MEIEDLLKQSILEDDSIESRQFYRIKKVTKVCCIVILSSLAIYFEVGISPVICSRLIIPILEHASRNPQLAKSVTIYSNTISSIYHYTCEEDLINTQIVFEETAKAIKCKICITLRNYVPILTLMYSDESRVARKLYSRCKLIYVI